MLKATVSAELYITLKGMQTMKDAFTSLAAALQQTTTTWEDLDAQVHSTTLLLSEHRMVVSFTDPASTKGSRRGVAKSCQDELIARGFTVGALPPALQAAMRCAIGMRPIA